MKDTRAPCYQSFEAIKQNFDPAFGYLVFEGKKARKGGEKFHEIVEVLSGFKHGKVEWQTCSDGLMKRAVLVVKVESGHEETVMDEIMDSGLRKDLRYFIYRSHPSI